jgi:hypothetical protein
VILQHGDLIGLPSGTREWRRRYRAAEHVANSGQNRFWRATIEAGGAYNGISVMRFTERGAACLHIYAAALLQTTVLAEWARRSRGRPDVEYVLDADFVCLGTPRFYSVDVQYGETSAFPWSHAQMGPYSIGSRDKFVNIFDTIERELWDLCGMARQEAVKLNFHFADVLRSTGL